MMKRRPIADLREIWPKLTDPQRDALVAMGMGWSLQGDREACLPWPPGESGLDKALRSQPSLPWSVFDEGKILADTLPRFASSWPGFGLIWEECERRGWFPEVEHLFMSVVQANLSSTSGAVSAAGDTPPQALALAFCIAAGVEVPAEWGIEG